MNQKVILKRDRTRFNVLANLFGRFWAAGMSLACVPIFVSYLGKEAYGLIGVYISLFTVANFFDLGLSTALNQILAVLNVDAESTIIEGKNSLRTFEIVYFVIGGVLSLALIAMAPWLSEHWLEVQDIHPQRIHHCLILMAALLFFQWPMALYISGFLGIERHLELNVIRVLHALFQWGGTALVVVFISTSIEAFFISQLVTNMASNLFMRHRLWKSLNKIPCHEAPRFDFIYLTKIKKYIGGLTLVAFFGVYYGQIDKFFISKLLPLSQLGIYTIAIQVGSSLMYLGIPIYQSVFPKISRMISEHDVGLENFYNRFAQFLTIVTVPVSILIYTYGEEMIYIWTQNASTSSESYRVAKIYVVAVNLFVLGYLPLTLMIASKNLRYNNIYASIAAIIILPFIYFSIINWGSSGPPVIICSYYLSWHMILGPLVHRKFFSSSWLYWSLMNCILPIAIAVMITLALHSSLYSILGDSMILKIAYWITLWGILCFVMLLSTSHGRSELFKKRSLLFS